MALVRTQTGIKNRIHAILHRHGIVHDFRDLFGAAGRRFLQGLMIPESTLGAAARATMEGYLQLLDQVRRQIAEVTKTIRQFVHRTPSAERLRTLPGVNYILAYTILAEIGRIERFRSAKQLASYSLLAPLADDSGEDDGASPKGRHVGPSGRRTLKWAFIEASHSAIRGDARMRAIFDQRTHGGKRDRNRGHITVAHALCRVVYVVLRKDVEYTLDPPARPGIRRRRRTSRPGTGQPDVARVAASTPSSPPAFAILDSAP
jgi:transposase